MTEQDDIFGRLLAQLPEVQAKKDELCREDVRRWLKIYGYQRLLEVIDEEQGIAFAQAENATHHTERQFGELQ